MDPMVMLGQDLAEAARSVGDRAAADLAARDRKMGNGHGETAGIGLAHRFHDASPARLTLRPPRACRERTWMCSWVLSAGLMASVATKRTRPWAKSGCLRSGGQPDGQPPGGEVIDAAAPPASCSDTVIDETLVH